MSDIDTGYGWPPKIVKVRPITLLANEKNLQLMSLWLTGEKTDPSLLKGLDR